MERKGVKVFGVVMALLLVFSLAATLSVSNTVSAGTQKWTRINIPSTDDNQLAPATDLGAIAVSPDGETLFAAIVGNPYTGESVNAEFPVGTWQVVKSTDGGYSWKIAGDFADVTAANSDTTQIVAIGISPDWENDGRVYVATQDGVYSSKDRGKAWSSRGASTDSDGNPISTINCMDVSLDENGDAIVVIGSTVEVYILFEGGWTPQYIGAGITPMNVLAVAFSPNYGEDGVVYAVANDGSITYLRGESDTSVNNWGTYIQDALFTNPDRMAAAGSIYINANHACMDFPDDYNSSPSVFVGLIEGNNAANTQWGDAFRVDIVRGTISTSAVNDLNIRGGTSRTNVWSIAVSGAASSATILVGLCDLWPAGPLADWTAQVHYSSNGGETWLQSYKPAGGQDGLFASPFVIVAPDFAESGIAYCSNGYHAGGGAVQFSGFYASTTQGTTWNGRGLLDHTIDPDMGDYISDILPSPQYDSDSTLFMVSRDANLWMGGAWFGLLWETKDGGSHWDLILGLTTMMPIASGGVSIDKVEIPSTYPDEPSIFVTGPTNCTYTADTSMLIRSTDEGNLFSTTIAGPYSSTVPLVIDAWVVIDKDTLIVANGSNIYKTTDMGAHWKLPTKADIETDSDETIVDMQLFNDTSVLVGTDMGNVYLCPDWENDFSFTQVGDTIERENVGNDLDCYIAFDPNFDDNGYVYAGTWDNVPPYENEGIYRIDANAGDEWECIWEGTNANPVQGEAISAIRCDGNGILWALSWNYNSSEYWPVRCVNPTAKIDDVEFESVSLGLGTGSSHTDLFWDLETAPTQTYVFALGANLSVSTLPYQIWAYIDTLTGLNLISPADGTTAAGTIIQGESRASVTLLWEDLSKAQRYDYQVAYDDQFGSLVDDACGITEGTQATVELILGGQYYWRVRVNGSVFSQWSDVWTFTTPLGPASAKPIITYPGGQDSHNDIETTPLLTWTNTVQATGFELILSENCDWANPVLNLVGSSALGPDTCYAITSALKEGTNYCWKVRAINEDTDTYSPWSDTGTFTTLVTPVVAEEGTPMWVWVVIALSAVLLVGVVVLIIRTRRPV